MAFAMPSGHAWFWGIVIGVIAVAIVFRIKMVRTLVTGGFTTVPA